MSEIINEAGLSVPSRLTAFKAAVSLAILGASAARFGEGTRDVLPEPVDVVDHAGNLAFTAAFIAHVSYVANGRNKLTVMTGQEYREHSKRVGIGCGAIALGLNIFAEKIGFGPSSTPDVLDFVYGCVGGYLGYKATQSKFINPTTLKEIVEDPATPDNVRKAIVEKISKSETQKSSEQRSAVKEKIDINPTIPAEKNRIRPKSNISSSQKNIDKKRRRNAQKNARKKNRR